MTSDDDKDPPVPADLVDAPKRIHHDPTPEDPDPSNNEALPDGKND